MNDLIARVAERFFVNRDRVRTGRRESVRVVKLFSPDKGGFLVSSKPKRPAGMSARQFKKLAKAGRKTCAS